MSIIVTATLIHHRHKRINITNKYHISSQSEAYLGLGEA
jgi:hypothetical protein